MLLPTLLFFGEAKRKTTLFGGVPKEAKEGHAHVLLPTLFSGTLFGLLFWGKPRENHIVWGGSLKKDMPTCSCQLYVQVPFLGLLFFGEAKRKTTLFGGESLKKDMPTCSCQLYFQVPFLGLLFFGEAKRKTTLFGGGP